MRAVRLCTGGTCCDTDPQLSLSLGVFNGLAALLPQTPSQRKSLGPSPASGERDRSVGVSGPRTQSSSVTTLTAPKPNPKRMGPAPIASPAVPYLVHWAAKTLFGKEKGKQGLLSNDLLSYQQL